MSTELPVRAAIWPKKRYDCKQAARSSPGKSAAFEIRVTLTNVYHSSGVTTLASARNGTLMPPLFGLTPDRKSISKDWWKDRMACARKTTSEKRTKPPETGVRMLILCDS